MEQNVNINSSLYPCSIGSKLQDICHKTSYTKTKGLHSFSSYPCDIQEILHLRTDCMDIQNVCYHHDQMYISKYTHLFGQTCCDPLERQCSTKRSLRNITIDRVRNSNRKLIPGRKICRQCEKLLAVSKEITDIEEDNSDLYTPIDEKEDVLNKSLSILGESPLKKKKFNAKQCVSYGKQKVEKINTVVKTTLASVLQVDADALSENKCNNCKDKYKVDSVDLQEILSALQQKFEQESTSVSEKLQILTIIPQSWTIEKTCNFFGTTEYMVKKSRKLRQEKGPLGVPGPKKASCTLPEHVVKDVREFYESPDVSRICPGKNDYITVRQPGQSKQEKQKYLILCNLKEAYTLFKSEYPNHKIGFSKFADLRPKWCVLAGSSGTHSVCVCMIHQNVKLMLASIKQSLSISNVLSHYVCDINNEACMLGHCLQCPLQTSFEEFLNTLMDDFDEESEVTFRQWVNTDRSTLISTTLSVPDFKSELLLKMKSLAKHHYIAKSQAEFLKTQKAELKTDECILLLDFSENFTFVVQDAIQGYHWENTQATLHPFVAYVQSNDKLNVISMCIISNCLMHDTVAVASFQRIVIPYLTSQYPNIKKIKYFSDGSSAQYKNKKNFLNLCHHKDDFTLHAEWHFFATSHGKSPCDGIGGTVKRSAYRSSLQRAYKDQIMAPLDLFHYCTENLKNIKFFFATEEHVAETRAFLSERLASAVRIEGTRDYHKFIPISKSKLLVSTVSKNTSNQIEVSAVKQSGKQLDISNISIGTYVACMYDKKWWLGVVLENCFEKGDIQIQFLHPHGPCQNFYWPEKPDTCWIPYKHLLDTVPMPSAATATGRMFSVSNDTVKKIHNLMLKTQDNECNYT